MIQVIAGEKGSGKTKKMVLLANDSVNESKGHIIYISNNSEVMYDLNSSIRLIDISHFPITNTDSFTGFIYGIISEDYDVECIHIDNLNSIIKDEEESIHGFISNVKKITENHGVKFVLGMKSSFARLDNMNIEYVAV